MNNIAAFAFLSLILTVTPGPDSLLVLRSSLRTGRHAGTRVAGGAASGSLFWGLCSAAGLTAIMAASAQAFRTVQLAGAAYLIILGIRGWRAARPPLASVGERPGPGPGFRAGLLSNVLNPKVGLFFLTVMPQLIPRHANVAGYGLAFAITDAVIAGAWLVMVAWISDKARTLLRRARTRTVLDRAAGTTLIALGVKVAAGQLA
ncbi:MAG: LysE family translocator [Actinobacteria bacterium]|nr:LysE family translocator [Actinomycetota bacterium]